MRAARHRGGVWVSRLRPSHGKSAMSVSPQPSRFLCCVSPPSCALSPSPFRTNLHSRIFPMVMSRNKVPGGGRRRRQGHPLSPSQIPRDDNRTGKQTRVHRGRLQELSLVLCTTAEPQALACAPVCAYLHTMHGRHTSRGDQIDACAGRGAGGRGPSLPLTDGSANSERRWCSQWSPFFSPGTGPG